MEEVKRLHLCNAREKESILISILKRCDKNTKYPKFICKGFSKRFYSYMRTLHNNDIVMDAHRYLKENNMIDKSYFVTDKGKAVLKRGWIVDDTDYIKRNNRKWNIISMIIGALVGSGTTFLLTQIFSEK